jgi:hypothetical protein
MVGDMLRGFRSEVIVRLRDEDFAEQLAAEVDEMRKRMSQIEDDLANLSYATDPDLGFGDERYRLAHRGQEPAPEADRAQLEAIEGRKAA